MGFRTIVGRQKKTLEPLKSLCLLFNLCSTFRNLHFRVPITAQIIKDELHALQKI